MSYRRPLPGHGRAENYTNAFLVSAGGLLFLIFMVIWAVWGLIAALGLAYGTDKSISLLAAHRGN